jgi:hypothetical protein
VKCDFRDFLHLGKRSGENGSDRSGTQPVIRVNVHHQAVWYIPIIVRLLIALTLVDFKHLLIQGICMIVREEVCRSEPPAVGEAD